MQITVMQQSEIETAAELVRSFYTEFGFPFDPVIIRSCLEELSASPDLGRLFFLQHDEKTVGFILITFGFSLEYHGRDAFIDELFVLPEFRNRGLGAAVIEYAVQFCKSEGIKAIHLEVRNNNPSALRLYRRLNFILHDSVLATRKL